MSVRTQHHLIDHEKRDRARERTAFVESLLQGTEAGATSQIERACLEAEEILRARAHTTGSKPVVHAANVLEAQRLLVRDKDLGDRFLRISRRLEEMRVSTECVSILHIYLYYTYLLNSFLLVLCSFSLVNLNFRDSKKRWTTSALSCGYLSAPPNSVTLL